MENTHWLKQKPGEPLFPDLVWSRPENRQARGKLLIIGGSSHGFRAPAEAYTTAETAGIGAARVLLPDAIRTYFSHFRGLAVETMFATSTKSGGFAKAALAEWLDEAAWSDAVMLAGDFGKNSETSVLIETFLTKYDGFVTLTGDTLDIAYSTPHIAYARPGTLAVASFEQLQRLFKISGSASAITSKMDLIHLVDALHKFSNQHKVEIITQHLETILVAVDGQVSTTKTRATLDKVAAHAAVWRLQNPSKPFEALTTSLVAD